MAWVADTVLLGAENPGRLVAPTALLTWKMVNQKMPWNIVLLLGGGFALAKGSEVRAPCSTLPNFHPVERRLDPHLEVPYQQERFGSEGRRICTRLWEISPIHF